MGHIIKNLIYFFFIISKYSLNGALGGAINVNGQEGAYRESLKAIARRAIQRGVLRG